METARRNVPPRPRPGDIAFGEKFPFLARMVDPIRQAVYVVSAVVPLGVLTLVWGGNCLNAARGKPRGVGCENVAARIVQPRVRTRTRPSGEFHKCSIRSEEHIGFWRGWIRETEVVADVTPVLADPRFSVGADQFE